MRLKMAAAALPLTVMLVGPTVSQAQEISHAQEIGPGQEHRPEGHPTLARLLQEHFAAWRANDAGRYGRTFSKDGDLVIFSGDHFHGRQQITKTFTQLFATFLKDTRLSGNPAADAKKFRFAAPDTAVLVSRGCVLRPEETTCPPQALSTQTSIAVKRHGTWLLTAFQNTRYQPLP